MPVLLKWHDRKIIIIITIKHTHTRRAIKEYPPFFDIRLLYNSRISRLFWWREDQREEERDVSPWCQYSYLSPTEHSQCDFPCQTKHSHQAFRVVGVSSITLQYLSPAISFLYMEKVANQKVWEGRFFMETPSLHSLTHGTRQAVKLIWWRVAKLSFAVAGLGADSKQNFIILQVAY